MADESGNEQKYFVMFFNADALERIDTLAVRLSCNTREETLRRALCVLGYRHGVEVPAAPVPEPYPPPGTTRVKRNPKSYVGIYIPLEGAPNSWLQRLKETSGIPSVCQLLYKAINENMPATVS